MKAKINIQNGQIWCNDHYYYDKQTGKNMRKYFLALAIDPNGDALTAVFTSKPNGLADDRACLIGPPREGYYLGVLGGQLSKETWVDFSSLELLDNFDLGNLVSLGIARVTGQTLNPMAYCGILRCLLQSSDITTRQARLLADTASSLNCP